MSEGRQVVQAVLSKWQDEGVGARVRRSVGGSQLQNLDPFLMLDEFSVQAPAGFPDHPHRGFETVTYMIKGTGRHKDFCGHSGILNSGDLQWMTAGRGIVHCEMPSGSEPCHGLQLWVNLAKKDKMIEPSYQELKAKDIPEVTKDKVSVKIIAGESFNVKSPVYTRTPTMYLDFTIKPGGSVTQATPKGWTVFTYILSGTGTFGSGEKKEVGPQHTVVLGDGDHVQISNNGKGDLHFVLIGGVPLNEPIVQKGPFVMNTKEEILQAVSDFTHGRNGFEKAPGWKSHVYQ